MLESSSQKTKTGNVEPDVRYDPFPCQPIIEKQPTCIRVILFIPSSALCEQFVQGFLLSASTYLYFPHQPVSIPRIPLRRDFREAKTSFSDLRLRFISSDRGQYQYTLFQSNSLPTNPETINPWTYNCKKVA